MNPASSKINVAVVGLGFGEATAARTRTSRTSSSTASSREDRPPLMPGSDNQRCCWRMPKPRLESVRLSADYPIPRDQTSTSGIRQQYHQRNEKLPYLPSLSSTNSGQHLWFGSLTRRLTA